MAFIELPEGFAINTDFIQAVENTSNGCIIHTSVGSHPSAFPYRLFLQLIEQGNKAEQQTVKLEPEVKNVLNSLGSFAG